MPVGPHDLAGTRKSKRADRVCVANTRRTTWFAGRFCHDSACVIIPKGYLGAAVWADSAYAQSSIFGALALSPCAPAPKRSGTAVMSSA
jgi:hypothetical protein